MKKRFLSLFLVIAVCLTLAVPAFADTEITGDIGKIKYQWKPVGSTFLEELFDDKYAVTIVKEADPEITTANIASEWDGEEVVAIDRNAFSNCRELTSVTIPDTVLVIGDSAFSGCRALPEILIPASVLVIGENTFRGCASLTKIEVAADNPNYCSVDGVLFSKDMKTLIAYPAAKPGASYTIPDTVTTIGEAAFLGSKNLTSVTIPSSVITIEHVAFSQFEAGMDEYFSVAHATRPPEDQYTYGLKDVYYSGTEAQWNAISIAYPQDFIAVTIHYGSAAPAQPQQPAQPEAPALTATPTASTVTVNGMPTAFDAYNIGGANYFKLRDLAFVLNGTEKQFGVDWDAAANAISLTSGAPYVSVGGEMTPGTGTAQTAAPTSSKILLNGAEVSLEAYNIGGNNYFKLRDIGSAFDFGVDWDGAANTVIIDTAKGYTP